jgi:hypothetical protein
MYGYRFVVRKYVSYSSLEKHVSFESVVDKSSEQFLKKKKRGWIFSFLESAIDKLYVRSLR